MRAADARLWEPYNIVVNDVPSMPKKNRAPLAARLVCDLTLSLPRFSPLRFVGIARRRQMIAAGAEPVTATSFDGVAIDALFFRARKAVPGRLPVILNHGYVEVKEMHSREVELLRRHGHDVLLYDLRAHGRSGGAFTTLGVWEKRDLSRLIDVAVAKKLIGERVITMGYSTGAATMLQHAADDSRVAGVVAQTPFLSLSGAVQSFRRKLGGWMAEEKLLRGFEDVAMRNGFCVDESDTMAAMQRLHVPVLLVVGDRDMHLPPDEHFKPLAAAAANPDNVELLVVPGADHVSIYTHRWPQLDEAITRFCAKLDAPPTA